MPDFTTMDFMDLQFHVRHLARLLQQAAEESNEAEHARLDELFMPALAELTRREALEEPPF